MFERVTKGDVTISRQLPVNVEDLSIILQCSAGIGDTLIAVGSVSANLKRRGAKVIAAVMPNHIPLIEKLSTVDKAVKGSQVNEEKFLQQHDVILRLNSFCLQNSRQLVEQDYYLAAFEKAGLSAEPTLPVFEGIKHKPKNGLIAIHASASHPLRRWPEKYWEIVARTLVQKGYEIVWLGTEKDFHMSGAGHNPLCDRNTDLVFQLQALAESEFFIGNDSGFCHTAGILDMPGTVLFSITPPSAVIPRYPRLQGLTKSKTFSRSTRNDNYEKEMEIFSTLTPDIVLTNFFGRAANRLEPIKQLPKVKTVRPDRREVICIRGHVTSEVRRLHEYFDLRKYPGKVSPDVDLILEVGERDDPVFENPEIAPCRRYVLTGAMNEANLRKRIRAQMGASWPAKIQTGNIRVVRYPGLGDVVMLTALLAKCREYWPLAHLTFETSANYFDLIPSGLIDTLTDEPGEADLTIRPDYYNFWNEGVTAFEKFGVTPSEMRINSWKDEPNQNNLICIWPRQGANPNVVKEWPDDRWIQLATELRRKGLIVRQIGGMRDRLVDRSQETILDGRCKSVRCLVSSINCCKALVTIEGAGQHIAKALGKTAVVLWGKSATPRALGYDSHINLVSKTEGSCWASIDPSTFESSSCCGGVCMQGVEVHEALKATMTLV